MLVIKIDEGFSFDNSKEDVSKIYNEDSSQKRADVDITYDVILTMSFMDIEKDLVVEA